MGIESHSDAKVVTHLFYKKLFLRPFKRGKRICSTDVVLRSESSRIMCAAIFYRNGFLFKHTGSIPRSAHWKSATIHRFKKIVRYKQRRWKQK